LKGRYIGNNIILIIDLIDYRHLIPDDSFILFIDFYKAFDTVEHSFMFKVIDFFGFGHFFKMQSVCFIKVRIVQSSYLTVPVRDLIWAVG